MTARRMALIALVLAALVLAACAEQCEVICCRLVEFSWGTEYVGCKTHRSDDCSCPDGYTVTDVLFYTTVGEEGGDGVD